MSSHRRSSISALLLVALAVVSLGACTSGDGRAEATPRDGELRVTDARVDYPANPTVAAAYFTIRNGTDHDDELVGVTTSVATATVHRSLTDEAGRATMVKVAALGIPAGSSVAFESGDLHVMLNDLSTDLEVGDVVPLDLRFREAGTVHVEAKVVEPQASGEATEETEHDH
ncbi:MAG: copper chaperone PCu(A)C [Acidimicrobiales bacterium]|nr:copper chaperone PCu(A)C [Acidimicrobiales bacterium]